MRGARSSILNVYCHDRLYSDILCDEENDILDGYEDIYLQINQTADRYIVDSGLDQDIQMNDTMNFKQIKRIYLDLVLSIFLVQNSQIGIDTMVMIFALTKTMMLKYKNHPGGPVFPSLICLQMYFVFRHLSSVWMAPSNRHRIFLEDRHVQVITDTS